MALENKLGLAMEQTAFAVLESTKGTIAFPTVAGEMIVGAGYGEVNQQPTFTDSEEIVDSLDILQRFQDMTPAGSWSFPLYLRPSGVAGTAPMGDAFYQSLMGKQVIDPGVSVVYSQTTTKPSFTLWVKKSHTVFFATGATCATVAWNTTNKGATTLNFSGGFMRMGWAGRSEVTGAVTADTDVTVATGQGKFFTAGARVKLGADDNTNAGYEIASVAGDVVTMTEVVTVSDLAVIEGFLPVLTPLGDALESRASVVSFDAVGTIVKSLDITIGTPVQYLENELTTEGYPVDYVPGRRDISGTLNLNYRAEDTGYFEDAYIGTKRVATLVTVGSVAGDIAKLSLPTTQLETPSTSADGDIMSMSMGLKGLGSGIGENSATITFQ